MMRTWKLAAGSTVWLALAVPGCGSEGDEGSDGAGAAAGTPSSLTGGTSSSSGGAFAGGTPGNESDGSTASGGETASGGTPGNESGGSTASGGETASGGTPGNESGGSTASGGETASGGTVASGGSSTNPPTQGEPCGEGWGSDPIPGSVDLGLASSPEINGVNNGTADERAIFDQINAERVNAGLEPLQWSDQVANVARSHAADMNQLDYFDHGSSTRPYRDETGQAIRENWLPLPRLEFVYPDTFSRAGENIAMTGDPVGNAVQMWMESDGHRAAILDEYGWTATHGAIGIDDRMVVFNPAVCSGG